MRKVGTVDSQGRVAKASELQAPPHYTNQPLSLTGGRIGGPLQHLVGNNGQLRSYPPNFNARDQKTVSYV